MTAFQKEGVDIAPPLAVKMTAFQKEGVDIAPPFAVKMTAFQEPTHASSYVNPFSR